MAVRIRIFKQMGCTPTPTPVKDAKKLPAINSYPSNRVMGQTSLENIVTAASRLTTRDYDEIAKYDIVIN